MRILMLSPGYPFPTDNGAKRRVLASAAYMSKHHELTIVAFQNPNSNPPSSPEKCQLKWNEYIINQNEKGKIETAIKAFFSKYSYPEVKYWNGNYQKIVSQLLSSHNFDCIWVHFLFMAAYIKEIFSKRKYGKKHNMPLLLLDQHNVDELTYRSFLKINTNIFMKSYAYLEMKKAQWLQKKWFHEFDAIFCVSKEDLRKTSEYVGENTELWLTPNGVDIDYFRVPVQEENTKKDAILIFGASLDVKMNQDAVFWFCSSIWPLIKAKISDAQFWIVGRNPNYEIKKLSGKQGIKVTGTVPDVRDYYRLGKVFVVPLRLGGGTKLKTLEAMAMGLPVVSTAVGAQGLEVTSGQHLYLADKPEEFADRVVELMRDPIKAALMGEAARLLVEKTYSWTYIMSEVEEKLKHLWMRKKKKEEDLRGANH